MSPLIVLVGCFSTYWLSLPPWYLFFIQGEVFSYVPFPVYMIRPEHTVKTRLKGWYPAVKKTLFSRTVSAFGQVILKKEYCLHLSWTNEHGYFSNLRYHLHNMLILVGWQGKIITRNSGTLVSIVNQMLSIEILTWKTCHQNVIIFGV